MIDEKAPFPQDEFKVLLLYGPFDHKIVKCGGSELIRVPIPGTETWATYEWSFFEFKIDWATGNPEPTYCGVAKFVGNMAADPKLTKLLATVHG